MKMNEPSASMTAGTTPTTWAEVDKRVRNRIEEVMRREVHSSRDQAERFRNKSSKHRCEAIACEHEEYERIYNDAHLVLFGRRVP